MNSLFTIIFLSIRLTLLIITRLDIGYRILKITAFKCKFKIYTYAVLKYFLSKTIRYSKFEIFFSGVRI